MSGYLKWQGARPGSMLALQQFAGGGKDAYNDEIDRLTKRDALRYQMGSDAATARKVGAEASMIEKALAALDPAMADARARTDLPPGITGNMAAYGLARGKDAEDLAKSWEALQTMGVRGDAVQAQQDGKIETMNQLVSILGEKPYTPFALNETGRINSSTGDVQYTPGHTALTAERNAAARENDAQAAAAGRMEVSPGASVYDFGSARPPLMSAGNGTPMAPLVTAPVAPGAGKGYGTPMEAVDSSGNRVFIQPDKAGGEPRVLPNFTPPTKQTLTGKDAQTAQGKIMAAENLLRQIAIAREKFKAASESFGSTGVVGGRNPLDRPGQAFDASIDALRSSVSALTRVPGVGAMSDYETRLDQSKIPNRAQYDDVTIQKLDELEALAKGIQMGYGDMLGTNEAANAGPTVTPAKNSKGWALMQDASGNRAYVGPNGEIEEVP